MPSRPSGPSRKLLWAILVGALLLTACLPLLRYSPPADAGAPLLLPLTIGEHTVMVEVAADPASRRQGLMFREHLPEGQGMLFVWPREARYGMWMKNTLIPLDVAFISADHRIIEIMTMQPETTDSHTASEPVRFALEVNAGWFERHGIEPGDEVGGKAFTATRASPP
ncbi:hypothetical protein M911_03465 [Ectothiorhodospira haloalkaliphila]|uniref:DUF192 domain-containing protein n=1 Tax=Ectothiorhodospira haloalkaliphila TaxID=421628 RepID=W8KS34_9GAMM|nr:MULTISPECIES: DUF192 domain-containing protein [Ectothiorhodospira]AHK78391.1 hypothetical protein M911_03465 [Ectothiorhodospira haloalkaliphila]MCG5495632.1 DUF192 domain-containing protein [Ectothiorhodospira variabilis]MCG5498837.1 DUF192 domain-containing protein [Ectothiorhodospira variabilis]MCG5504693.1 DUF192 domain-containing protein [Ectothiorhodospira variabilis]MCG5507850.1 DUF192 domain-containing protein [Ectothiorhodospira variabilis]